MSEDWAQRLLLRSFKEKIDVTIKKVAKDYNFSVSNFYNKWRLNLSPKKFLTILRLVKALKFLSSNHKKIKDIVDDLKFCDHFYFCKWFKKLTGITPKRFQMKYSLYFRQGLYQKIRFKNFDVKNIFWILKILENENE
ncbi:MAG: helix-turn-helix transcriptional regulator [candidate division WOR-3 bacterium]|nr:helix-turn-helix transcriptional regulator [candidate division WOR-3 bacterium]MCX7836762.1 helix-turn-helix transcriptional regulator [candidate division WOR-3 bacterium]MDW8113600.1 helix-turn-helix transcriptional regulator [candidate division WOR-3 bacterium]